LTIINVKGRAMHDTEYEAQLLARVTEVHAMEQKPVEYVTTVYGEVPAANWERYQEMKRRRLQAA
jgi:phenylpyruvate tautomerase PptA (4-oxalocrotonate tautomerase family)